MACYAYASRYVRKKRPMAAAAIAAASSAIRLGCDPQKPEQWLDWALKEPLGCNEAPQSSHRVRAQEPAKHLINKKPLFMRAAAPQCPTRWFSQPRVASLALRAAYNRAIEAHRPSSPRTALGHEAGTPLYRHIERRRSSHESQRHRSTATESSSLAPMPEPRAEVG
jgi:hypothetical protein